MAEPIDVLLKGIKTVWDAQASLIAMFGTRVFREEQPADKVSFPYVVIEVDGRPNGYTCDSQFTLINVTFYVYDRTAELCAAGLTEIIDTFGDENLQITLSTGSVIKKFEGEVKYEQQDPKVWLGSVEYEFETNKPRNK